MQTKSMPKKCKAVNRGRIGWAVQWEDGATSYMPDEATAKAMAAAPDLLAVCQEINEHGTDDWEARMKTLRAALAEAGR